MVTFAVIWWIEGTAPLAGKLEVGASAVRLSGRNAEPLAVALDEVVDAAISRSTVLPAGGRTTLVVRLRDGRTIFVESVVGFAVLHELADVLAPPHPYAA
jgi:hypothetical protein